jgi:pyridoxal phosphate enzyme (YggS family)
MTGIQKRIDEIHERIRLAAVRAGRNPVDIRLVAVTKTIPLERIREAVAAGLRTFGENYIQEARDKFRELADPAVSWHFIGHLQTNKAKYAVRQFDLIHTVDSLRLAEELNREATKLSRIQEILIQVNISMEPTKSGVAENDAFSLIQGVSGLSHLRIRGLMTMPPYDEDPECSRPFFRALRVLADRIRGLNMPGVSMADLSMGMSHDFEIAIEEGATLVRIGTAIFGERS